MNRIVVELAGVPDFFLRILQFAHQLLEIGIGFQLRIIFDQKHHAVQGGSHLIVGFHGFIRRGRIHDGRSGLNDGFQRTALVAGCAFYGFHQARDQIRPVLHLHIHLRVSVAHLIAHAYQSVVHGNDHQGQYHDDS
ncbi:hypothetical protein SDC9_191776 [bioreactor metagenome]|uniref:Uncharacterized protein n=1 Tax=bioreactor metagenome TaxID=1076179 RepID=A0A645HYU6_9ZZZZ